MPHTAVISGDLCNLLFIGAVCDAVPSPELVFQNV